MRFHVLTLFPEMIRQGMENSIIGRAMENNIIEVHAVNIRDYTMERHGKVDDYPYGGGAGMLMQAQPVYDAWKAVADTVQEKDGAESVCSADDEDGETGKRNTLTKRPRTVYVTPKGRPFTQKLAEELSRESELILLCGHYEGIDERVLEEIVTDPVSIGDYVLTGGELAAMVMIDAIARLVPGVLHNETSATSESFCNDLLEYPQYSRPEEWHGKRVPEVLLSGDHKKVEKWRLEQAERCTERIRPDLFAKYERKRRVIQRFSNPKRKRDLIHLTESLARGQGELLYEDGDDVLVYEARCRLAILTATSPKNGEEMLALLPEDIVSVMFSQEFMIPILKDRFGMHVDMECQNACYTAGVKLPVRHKDIRVLTVETTDYVCKHYPYGNQEYVEGRIKSGALFGVYMEDELAAFGGEHEEGSLGMLFVHPDYRRQGIGASLEAFLINRHLDMGYTPYGQIVVGNDDSARLQERNGVYLSKGHVWWMSVGDKWQGEAVGADGERNL